MPRPRQINGSKYCQTFHERAAKQAGLDEADIRNSGKAGSDDRKTQALLQFVQAFGLQRGEPSNDDFTAIREAGFSESEIIEVLANLGYKRSYLELSCLTDDMAVSDPGRGFFSQAFTRRRASATSFLVILRVKRAELPTAAA